MKTPKTRADLERYTTVGAASWIGNACIGGNLRPLFFFDGNIYITDIPDDSPAIRLVPEPTVNERLLEACEEALASYGRNGDLSAEAMEMMEDAIADAKKARE